ncbi:MAG: polysaccharide deacetylase family protein [Alphaproteobacteria bacterium]|nr:polysaccharide deacetylase family protein [Alphaproteobacteria bacterium]
MANNPATPQERITFSAIEGRARLVLPDGARLVVWPVLALERWDLAAAMPRTVLPPPQGQPLLPDIPNWSWHEYGMRVGFWRIKKIFERLDVRPTVTINAAVCETYEAVVAAVRDNGWEFNAHSYTQVPMHKLDDQKSVIEKSLDIIEAAVGKRPRGWFGPGLTQTLETMDLLAGAGIEYIGDLVLDDQPVTVTTEHGPIVALPYNFEIHDIAQQMIQYHSSEVFLRRAVDAFDWLYAEAQSGARILSLAVHPYISGQAHRIRYVQEALEYMIAKPGVLVWDGEQILDWYLKERATS